MHHGDLNVEVFVEGSFGENAYVVSAPATHGVVASGRPPRVGWIVDPSFPPAVEELLEFVNTGSILIEKIVLTHGHADHIAGLDDVKAVWGDAPVWIAR